LFKRPPAVQRPRHLWLRAAAHPHRPPLRRQCPGAHRRLSRRHDNPHPSPRPRRLRRRVRLARRPGPLRHLQPAGMWCPATPAALVHPRYPVQPAPKPSSVPARRQLRCPLLGQCLAAPSTTHGRSRSRPRSVGPSRPRPSRPAHPRARHRRSSRHHPLRRGRSRRPPARHLHAPLRRRLPRPAEAVPEDRAPVPAGQVAERRAA
jgi:hypothetical protein